MSSHGKGVFGPPVVCGFVGFIEPYGESAVDGLGAHTDGMRLIMIMDQSASFGVAWGRRAGRQTSCGVTPKVSTARSNIANARGAIGTSCPRAGWGPETSERLGTPVAMA